MRKMRHKNWKTYLKIACSWLLIFSICFMNLETVSASEDETSVVTEQEETQDTEAFTSETDAQQTETEQTSEQFTSETETETSAETEEQIPDSIEVEKLEKEIQEATSNGQVPTTKLVEYVDESGNAIEGAPETIELGKISDHSELNISDKDYEFKSAKVNDADCSFIGVYKDTVYWSSDNINANKFTDGQKLIMTYALKEKEKEFEISKTEDPEQEIDTTETTESETEISEKSSEQIVDNEKSTEQASNEQLPDTISVQSLNIAMQRSVANGDEQTTDRVEYVDVNGTAIEGAPTTIELGNIDDHKKLTISGSGKNYEFKSAKVNGKDCVYIGKYEDTVYYSTDGKIAIKLEDGQKLTMTYQEYYNITIKEDIPENGVAGTITHDGKTVDTSSVVRVDAGEAYSINVQPATANKVRYKISNISAEASTTTITQNSGNEYGAKYTINFQTDDTLTIGYSGEGIYRINVKTTDVNGNECVTTDKSHYSGGYINDFTFTESNVNIYDEITLPVFHTCNNKRIICLQVNGAGVLDATTHKEVPSEGNTSLSPRLTTPNGNQFSLQISVENVSSLLGAEKNCDYEYKITIKKLKGNWEDLNFVPTYGERKVQSLTLKAYTSIKGNMVRSDEGLQMAMWDYSDGQSDQLVEVKDNDVFSMDPTKGITRRQVKFFFAKAKPGFYISIHNGTHVSGVQNTEDTYEADGTIDELTANTLSGANLTNLKDNWENAKNAAKAAGYTHFVVISGEMGHDGESLTGFEWDLYFAQFVAKSIDYYAMYDEGDLPNGSVVSNMPESDMKTRSNKYKNNPYTNKPVFGTRTLSETFQVGEKTSEPICEGYKFIGWKLVDANGNEEKIYPNNAAFTIDTSNVAYGNTKFVDTRGYSHDNAYRFVAQWQKIGTRSVKVNHYLKVPNGTEKLEKTTEGTISFAEDNETVTAFAKPEPAGTFPGYIFDKEDSTLEKTVTNDASTGTIELNLYYKPTVLTVSKIVSGYNLELDKAFSFTIQANAPDGTDTNAATLSSDQVYIKKENGTAEKLTFTNNQATFTLKKDEYVDISCLPTGWTYTVTETEPGTNFKASYSINGGTVTDGAEALFTMATTGSEAIQFTNTSTIAPPVTGRDIQNSSWIMMLIVALLIGMSGVVFFRKVKRKYR